MKGEVLMKEELSKEEEELAEMVAINDDDIYPLAGKRSIWGRMYPFLLGVFVFSSTCFNQYLPSKARPQQKGIQEIRI